MPDLVGVSNVTGAFTQAGAIQLHRLAHWIVRSPRPADGWAPGATATLRWAGTPPAQVALSTDGGRTWRTIARRAGGQRSNTLCVPVPPDARDRVRVRLAGVDGDYNPVERDIPLGGR